MRCRLVVVAPLLALAVAAHAEPAVYILDPDRNEIEIRRY